jgi:hypothetical protein
MTALLEYLTYHCKVHQKFIYYFKADSHITGKYHCFDCLNEERKHKSNANSSSSLQPTAANPSGQD